MTIRLAEEKIDAKKVRGLAEGLLQSFGWAHISPLESMAACMTAFNHVAMNVLEGSTVADLESNRDLMASALYKALNRILEYRVNEGRSEVVS